VKPVGQSPSLHHPAGELVDQHDLAIPDDVVLVLLEELVRPERLRRVMDDRGRFRVVERLALGQDTGLPEPLFEKLVARLGEGGIALLFVELEMLGGQFRNELVERDVKL